jgi:glycosyltransferase involved in cell wall biosynthesis
VRVAIDASALGSTRGGDETFLRGLLLGLAEVADLNQDRYPLLLPPDAALPMPLRGNPLFPVHTIPREQRARRYGVTMPRVVKQRGDLDLLFTMLHAPFTARVPLALYVPDLSFRRVPEYFPLATRLRLNLLVPLHLRLARVVITLSEYSRRDLIVTYGISPHRVHVVPCAVVPPEAATDAEDGEEEAEALPEPPYFVYVGNLHPRKNVPRLIAAFARARQAEPAMARHRLVIAGGRWWGGGEQQAARAAPPNSVIFLGRVTDRARQALLERAEALVFPSLFEGFGLPPLEAMALGTAVLASNVTSIPEVVGDAGLLVDPLDDAALARGLIRLAMDPGLRAKLGRRGRERAQRFSPRAAGAAAQLAFRGALRL